MPHRPVLSQVTLCAVDCAAPDLALRALRLSRQHCAFAASLLLTSHQVGDPDIEVRAIPPIGRIEEYSLFVQKHLAAHIATPFVLLVQWDGYVVDGSLWQDRFLQSDYIGAPWWWEPEGRQVGNGGFSLRSRRLMERLAAPDWPVIHPEDVAIGRDWRPALEQQGFRFADIATAWRFSVEGAPPGPRTPSFGFHGLPNFTWAVSPAELPSLLAAIPAASLNADWAAVLLLRYANEGRWVEADHVRQRLEAQLGPDRLDAQLARFGNVPDGQPIRRAVAAMATRGG